MRQILLHGTKKQIGDVFSTLQNKGKVRIGANRGPEQEHLTLEIALDIAEDDSGLPEAFYSEEDVPVVEQQLTTPDNEAPGDEE